MNKLTKVQASAFLSDLKKINHLLPEQEHIDDYKSYDSYDATQIVSDCMEELSEEIIKDKTLFAGTPGFREEALNFDDGEALYMIDVIDNYHSLSLTALKDENGDVIYPYVDGDNEVEDRINYLKTSIGFLNSIGGYLDIEPATNIINSAENNLARLGLCDAFIYLVKNFIMVKFHKLAVIDKKYSAKNISLEIQKILLSEKHFITAVIVDDLMAEFIRCGDCKLNDSIEFIEYSITELSEFFDSIEQSK